MGRGLFLFIFILIVIVVLAEVEIIRRTRRIGAGSLARRRSDSCDGLVSRRQGALHLKGSRCEGKLIMMMK